MIYGQGWGAGAGAGRRWVFLAPWSRSRLKKKPGAGAAWKKSQEPEPLKKFAGSSSLLEDKKHKEILL